MNPHDMLLESWAEEGGWVGKRSDSFGEEGCNLKLIGRSYIEAYRSIKNIC